MFGISSILIYPVFEPTIVFFTLIDLYAARSIQREDQSSPGGLMSVEFDSLPYHLEHKKARPPYRRQRILVAGAQKQMKHIIAAHLAYESA